jgi:hypothetical protein
METRNVQKKFEKLNYLSSQMKVLIFSGSLTLMLILASEIPSLAQVGTLTNTGDMSVCISSNEPYGVMPVPGSTYTWSIVAGTGGAGTISTTANSNLISVNWTSPGTCRLRVIESNGTCTGLPIDILITVNSGLIPGTASANQTICYNTIPAQLTANAPTGAPGPYTYQWEASTDNGSTWTVLTGANGLNYQPVALTQTAMYHLKQSSGGGCGDATTNNITITVQPQILTSPIYHN